jgi:hypothetical protein
MSQADGNSTEAESASGTTGRGTQVGCYRNFDHFPSRHRRSNSSQPAPSLPIAAGPDGGLSNPPPPPPSPPPTHQQMQHQQLLLDLPPVAAQSGEQTDEQQPLTRSPGDYASPVSCLHSSSQLRQFEAPQSNLHMEFEQVIKNIYIYKSESDWLAGFLCFFVCVVVCMLLGDGGLLLCSRGCFLFGQF